MARTLMADARWERRRPLKQCRHVATRYEQRVITSLAMRTLAAMVLWV